MSEGFLNTVDYSNLHRLRQLLRQYRRIEQRAYRGDLDSLIVKIDLDNALKYANLTKDQKLSIKLCCVDDISPYRAGKMVGKSNTWIISRLEKAIVKMSVYLTTGTAISNNEAKERLKAMKEIEMEDEVKIEGEEGIKGEY